MSSKHDHCGVERWVVGENRDSTHSPTIRFSLDGSSATLKLRFLRVKFSAYGLPVIRSSGWKCNCGYGKLLSLTVAAHATSVD